MAESMAANVCRFSFLDLRRSVRGTSAVACSGACTALKARYKKKGSRLVPIDKGDCFAAEGVGQVGGFVDALGAAQDFVVATPAVRRGRGAAPPRKPKNSSNPRSGGRSPSLRAEVPFADHPGRIAGRLEPLGERLFVADQAEVRSAASSTGPG